ncbi:MAG: 2Fe-2S iron-sulfur cluster-binding protein [Chitinophagales bacterium]
MSTSNKQPQFHTLKISNIAQENRHAISVYFEIPEHLQSIFTYKAGQYITLRIRILGRFILRSYSLSSCSATDNYFRICIKRKVGGLVSGFLVDTLRKGDELEVFPPLGDFSPSQTLQPKNYFLYAAGSGITPIISILKCLLTQNTAHKITLFYTNRNQQLAIYWDELQQLQYQFGEKFVFYPIFTKATKNWKGLRNFYKPSDYTTFLQQNYDGQLKDSEHFICGPTAMMQTVESALLKNLGIDFNQIHVEYFDMSKQAQEMAAHRKHLENAAEKLNIPAKISLDDEEVIPAMVVLNGQPHHVPIQKRETILAACLKQDLDVPFMCESGVCTTCRASLLEGQVDMKVDYALTESEIKEGYILTCQAIPVSTSVSVNFDI